MVPGGSLLIIDDEPAIGTLIRRVGEACGYRVAAVHEPESFKRQFHSDPPSVICLDLAMPGMDGIETLRFLAHEQCPAQLLIISGYDSGMVSRAVRLGEALGLSIAAVMPKPISIAELRVLLSQLQAKPGQADRPAAA